MGIMPLRLSNICSLIVCEKILPGFVYKLIYGKRQLYKDLYNLLGFHPGNLSFARSSMITAPARRNSGEQRATGIPLGRHPGRYYRRLSLQKYPYKTEGYLTEMRSKIVNRQQLNDIMIKMGLVQADDLR